MVLQETLRESTSILVHATSRGQHFLRKLRSFLGGEDILAGLGCLMSRLDLKVKAENGLRLTLTLRVRG